MGACYVFDSETAWGCPSGLFTLLVKSESNRTLQAKLSIPRFPYNAFIQSQPIKLFKQGNPYRALQTEFFINGYPYSAAQ